MGGVSKTVGGGASEKNCVNLSDKVGVASHEEEVTSSSEENCGQNKSNDSRQETLQSSQGETIDKESKTPVAVEGKNSTKTAEEDTPSTKDVGKGLPHINGEIDLQSRGRESGELGGGAGGVDSGSVRLRSCSAGATVAVRRMSVESGQLARQHERLLMEKRRRRWSLNTPNNLNNSPQVRMEVVEWCRIGRNNLVVTT